MAQYKMKSLSVQLGNRVVRKDETPKINGNDFPAEEIAAAERAGFIEKVESKQSSGQGQNNAKSSGQKNKKE